MTIGFSESDSMKWWSSPLSRDHSLSPKTLTVELIHVGSILEEPGHEFLQHFEESVQVFCDAHYSVILLQMLLGKSHAAASLIANKGRTQRAIKHSTHILML